MQSGFVSVNGVSTHVVTFGGWIEHKLEGKELILCIPGNPGVTGFYKIFLETIYSRLGIPVWAMSHAGHELPPDKKIPVLKHNRDVYDLQGQVQHKVDFIKRYVPADVTIYLVGHSIGCKLILELLKMEELSSQVKKCYFLFPTIERMVETPNGKFLTSVVLRILPIMLFLSWIFTLFPRSFQRVLVYIYFAVSRRTNEDYVDTVVDFIHPVILENVFFMGEDEMVKVKELDSSVLNRFGDIFTIYYGTSDKWSPVAYCYDLRKKHPNIKAEIFKEQFEHAFVLKSSKDAACIISQCIENDKNI